MLVEGQLQMPGNGSCRGGFHAEFWVKDNEGIEHRYKVEDVHPEVRQGHRVIIYKYSDHLALLRNQSSGRDVWFIPRRLLRGVYPDYKNPMILVAACLGVVSFGFFAIRGNSIDSLVLLMIVVAAFAIYCEIGRKNDELRRGELARFFEKI